MTTIVYRNGVLAADRRAYSGDKKPIGAKTKIYREEDGTIWGVSSNCVGAAGEIRRWLQSNTPVTKETMQPESFELLLINPKGEVFLANGNLELTGPLEADYFAIGSGDHFAMGALEMGADAVTAVQVASRLDIWSGNGVDALTVHSEPVAS